MSTQSAAALRCDEEEKPEIPVSNDETKPGSAHWQQTIDHDGVCWLTLDQRNSATNTLSSGVLQQFDDIIHRLSAAPPRGLIIRSAKTSGFIVGADITEFSGLDNQSDIEDYIRRGHATLDCLEKLPCPTVALLHGFCLGGGLELALACRYRIARDDTKLGLPEVRLGIHPGLGGTLRLPRLLPATTALDLMLSGRIVDASKARHIGLVDVVTPQRHIDKAALDTVHNGLKSKRNNFLVPLYNSAPGRALLAPLIRRKTEKKVSPQHYPAPFALIDLWQQHGGDREELLKAEARSLAELITGTTAQNLIRVFFLRERLKKLGKQSGADNHLKRIHVIGAGTMGGDIAAWSVLQGFQVTLQDQSPELIAPALRRANQLFERKLRQPAKIRDAFDRLMPDIAGSGLASANIVIEAISEKRDAKQQLYRDIEPRMQDSAILATNTSSIPLQDLAESLDKPERLIGLHFFNPVAKMPLVEVVYSDTSSASVQKTAQAFVQRIGKLPLPVRSRPGFLVNRVLMPYLLEAVTALQKGVSAEHIDAAAEKFGMPLGPIELADRVGLDICLQVGEELGAELPKILTQKVEDNDLGIKSGAGFYRYKDGKAQKTEANLDQTDDTELRDRLILPLLNASVACVRENIVEDADLADAGLIFGAGFAPFRGGPLHYAKTRGIDEIRERFDELAARYGQRFQPDAGWDTLKD